MIECKKVLFVRGSSLERHRIDVWQYPNMLVERYLCAPGAIEGVARHAHEEYQFCLSAGVACVYDYRGARHVVPRGGMSVIHPGELHATSDAEPRQPGATYHMLYLDPIVLQNITAELRGRPTEHPYFPMPVISDTYFLDLFRTLYEALEGGADQLERDVLYYTALSQLIAQYAQSHVSASSSVSAQSAVVRARDFLHDNPLRKISLEELARVAGLSAFRLCHAFQQEIGLPPHEYHLQIRIVQAKALIARGLPLAQVAEQTGFYDQSRFGRYFKRYVGTTPGYYARNCKR